MNKQSGLTLLECILSLSIFSIVLSVVMIFSMTAYRMVQSIEEQVETEENVRAAVDRISETIRYTDRAREKVEVSGKELNIYIDDVSNPSHGKHAYTLLKNGTLKESFGGGVNDLAHNISVFEPSLEKDLLTIKIGREGTHGKPAFTLKKVFYLGDE